MWKESTAVMWFGGFIADNPAQARVPERARVRSSSPLVWTSSGWPDSELRDITAGDARVFVFGPCTATDTQLRRSIDQGVDPIAWAGSFVIAIVRPGRVEVVTDLALAQPVYAAAVPGGVAWGSSARALAGLAGAGIDRTWLALSMLAPSLAAGFLDRSPFLGVRLLPAGSRVTITTAGLRHEPAWQASNSYANAAAAPGMLAAAVRDGVRVRAESSAANRQVGQVTADCSGGLDSATLCLLAAADAPDGGVLRSRSRCTRPGQPPAATSTTSPTCWPTPAAGCGTSGSD
jgi:asparagine synthase (glutamine-hydrolysing)